MGLINNIKIGSKITGLVFFLIVIFTINAAWLLSDHRNTGLYYQDFFDKDMAAASSMTHANRHLQSVGYRAYQYISHPVGSQISEIAIESYELNIERLLEWLNKSKSINGVQEFIERSKLIEDEIQKAMESHRSDNKQATELHLANADNLIDDLTTDIRIKGDQLIADVNQKSDNLLEETDSLIVINMSGFAVIAFISLAFSLYFSQFAITRPLASIRGSMLSIANGNIDNEVAEDRRKDEIGDIARSVETFRLNAIQSRSRDMEVARLRQEREEERRITEEENERRHEEDLITISSLSDGLSALASGDLTFRIKETFSPRTEQLKTDFNDSIGKLEQAISAVSHTISSINTGANEISSAADDMSRRTEQQAASLEETAAALDEITTTVKQTASNSSQAREVAASAKNTAESSGLVVRQAISAMSSIERSSEEISQIISVIDEIAFQTNLLALNAGVEAARAGDAGRGFAVVASEVRALAQRSAEAAKEIKRLISTSTDLVSEGVDLVAATGKELEKIVNHVTDINSVINDIAASAQEQSSGLAEVNMAVIQMDQVTQQNAAMVEESTASSHQLAQESEELARLINNFKIGKSERDKSITTTKQKSYRTNSVIKSTNINYASQQPSLIDDDGWTEF